MAALELYDFYTSQIEACDAEIEKLYRRLEDRGGAGPQPVKPKKKIQPSKNNPDYDLQAYLRKVCGVDLTAIEGVGVLTVQTLVSECGTDMSKFPTVKHWTSWLGLAPNPRRSGGKVLSGGAGVKTDNRARQALKQVVPTLHHSEGPLGRFYRRMKAIHGPAIANKATAHKMARIIYHMLRFQQEYDDGLYKAHEERRQTQIIANLKKKARYYAMELIPIQAER